MLIYLLIYIPFILCAYFDFVKTDPKKTNKIIWFWIIVFTLFRGLRWEIGTDWNGYYWIHEAANFNNVFSLSRGNNNVEWGYVFLNAASKWINTSYTFFLLVTNFYILFCYKFFCQKITVYPLITFIFFVMAIQQFPTRQPLSTATLFLSYVFLIEKKYRYFTLLVFAAVFIHRGSLIALSLYFIIWFYRKHQVYWWVYAGLYVISFFASLAFEGLSDSLLAIASISGGGAEELLGNYMNMTESNSVGVSRTGSIFSIIVTTIIFSVVLYVYYARIDYIKSKFKGANLFFAMFAIFYIVHNLLRNNAVTGVSELAGRVVSSFNTTALFLPVVLIYFVDKVKIQRGMMYLFFVIYTSYMFYRAIPGNRWSHMLIPYKTIFEKESDPYEGFDKEYEFY